MPENDTRLQDIESKIAFQEHLLESLNEALTSQQQQLDALQQQLARIGNRLETTHDDIKRPDEETPPPHY
ncbi:MAG: SlyX family protein [Mariprofundaceae bacterium]